MKRILIGTTNPSKLKRFEGLLSGFDVEFLTLNDLGITQEPEETEQPQEDEAKSTGMGGLVVFLVVALIGGGAALYFFKFKKPKADTKGNDDLDEYDFGEEDSPPAEPPSPCTIPAVSRRSR